MVILWLVLSKLSKEPSQLHNTTPAAFPVITIGCIGLQSHYAGTVFKTLWKWEGHKMWGLLFLRRFKAKAEIWWWGVRVGFVDV